jgi:SAM-dependent methyltransferase
MTNFENKAKLFEYLYKKYSNKKMRKILEPGFGEGFTLRYFDNIGVDTFGIDISDEGYKFHNKQLESKSNLVIDNFEKDIFFKEKFNLVVLDHFLEHVFDLEDTMRNLKHYCDEDTLVIVLVPNDFNLLQEYYLLDQEINKLNSPWINQIEHLRYFSKSSLQFLFNSFGFEKVGNYLSDFPIELNLIHAENDYYINLKNGKRAHFTRTVFENLLYENSVDKYASLMEGFALNNIGRNLIGIFKIANID